MVMQKFLKKDQLNLVVPKFQKMVKEAWDNGEEVPYGVIYLSDKELTDEEIKHINFLKK